MSTKRWIIIFAVFAAILIAAMCVMPMLKTDSETAGVFQDGKLLYEIEISGSDATYTVTYEGRENVICVENGEVFMAKADCPDQVCVLHGSLTGAEPIVCLPNRLVIRWLGESSAAVDVVTGR